MQSGQRFICFGPALRFVVSLLCQSDSGFKRVRGILILPSGLWCRCYASRTVVANVPGGLWFCPPVCGVVVMQAGQRFVFCGSALRFVVSLLCKPDSGFKRARVSLILPSDLCCRFCCVSRTAVSNVHVPDLRFVVLLLCQQDSASKRAWAVTFAVTLSSDLWCCCCATSRTAV